jgi:DNA mismatch repair protein MutH
MEFDWTAHPQMREVSRKEGTMSKYDALGTYLRQRNQSEVPMTFSEIEAIVGFTLPKSHKRLAWWSNSVGNNVMTRVWINAGYRADKVDVAARTIVFKRIAADSSGRGLFDARRDYAAGNPADAGKPRRKRAR